MPNTYSKIKLILVLTMSFNMSACLYLGIHQATKDDPQKTQTAQALPKPKDIYQAIKQKNLAKTQEYLTAGVNLDAPDKDGWYPLQLAIEQKFFDGVLALLQAGARVDCPKDHTVEPLYLLAAKSHSNQKSLLESAKIMLAKGAKVDFRGQHNKTSLHLAVTYHNFELAKLLLENGAAVNAKESFSGETALHNAADGQMIYDPNTGPSRHSMPELIDLLFANGADVYAIDKSGQTPLHLAAKNLQLQNLDRLMAAGAQIDARTKYGFTPIHLAAAGWGIAGLQGEPYQFCDFELIDYLIAQGAKTDLLTPQGKSYQQLFDEKCQRVEKEPLAVKQRRAEFNKANDPERLAGLVLNTPREDALTLVGPFHGYTYKWIYYEDTIVHTNVWKIWAGGRFYRLYFHTQPLQNLRLNIAGLQKSHQVTVGSDNILQGGRLIRIERDGVSLPLSVLDLDETETQIRLFESNGSFLTTDKRKYATSFEAKAQFINWELNLFHQNPENRKDFVVHFSFLRSDGNTHGKGTLKAYSQDGWKSSSHCLSWGNKTPGYWKPGNYTVQLQVLGKTVAKQQFQVY